MRGHGASPLPAGFRWSLAALVDDLLAVADATGAERFHLVGESTGGTVALAVAARHPERVLSVTVSNGAHRGGSIRNLEPWRRIIREEGMAAWSAHMMGQRFFEDALTDGMRRWYETRQADSDPDAILGATAMLVAVDLLPELQRVTCPVLLLHPDSSPFIPVETMAELKRALPDARLQVFAHARHGLPFSHAAECAAAVAGFIDAASPWTIHESRSTAFARGSTRDSGTCCGSGNQDVRRRERSRSAESRAGASSNPGRDGAMNVIAP